MEDVMYKNLDKDDILSRVTNYEVIRANNEVIHIHVYEVLFSEPKKEGKFIAQPHALVKFAPNEYIGEGKTDVDALNNCLGKIKGVSRAKILNLPPDSDSD
jgi:hypothetical protein